jgi:riboflavin synthase alpha subunit
MTLTLRYTASGVTTSNISNEFNAASIEALMVLHGSVAVDGVSLTVNDLKPGGLQLSLIEYTLRHTTLGELKEGSRVQVEADVVAKHVRRLLEPYMREASALTSLTDFSLEHYESWRLEPSKRLSPTSRPAS